MLCCARQYQGACLSPNQPNGHNILLGQQQQMRVHYVFLPCCLCCVACRYRDALSSMTEAQGNFATALADFGCGSDEDSLIMGECNSYCCCYVVQTKSAHPQKEPTRLIGPDCELMSCG